MIIPVTKIWFRGFSIYFSPLTAHSHHLLTISYLNFCSFSSKRMIHTNLLKGYIHHSIFPVDLKAPELPYQPKKNHPAVRTTYLYELSQALRQNTALLFQVGFQ